MSNFEQTIKNTLSVIKHSMDVPKAIDTDYMGFFLKYGYSPSSKSLVLFSGLAPFYYPQWSEASKVQDLDDSKFSAEGVTTALAMFFYCSNLTHIDLSYFDFSAVLNMGSMFGGCSSLSSVNLTGISTSHMTIVGYMFLGCTSLQTIICPGGFDLSSCDNISNMFTSCGNLTSPLHLKNVNHTLIESGSSPEDWIVSEIGGTRGIHYIVDSIF